MLPVEGLRHRLADGSLPGIVNDHPDPGHRLQNRPVKAQRQRKRRDEQYSGYSA